MDITNGLMQFIPSQLVIVCVVLFCIGAALKAIKKIPNEFIPFILGILGIIFAVWETNSFCAQSVLQGIVCAAVATYTKNLIKQGANLVPVGDATTEEKAAE